MRRLSRKLSSTLSADCRPFDALEKTDRPDRVDLADLIDLNDRNDLVDLFDFPLADALNLDRDVPLVSISDCS